MKYNTTYHAIVNRVDTTLSLFGLNEVKLPAFIREDNEIDLVPLFAQMLDTREHYHEFLDNYIDTVEEIEDTIRDLKWSARAMSNIFTAEQQSMKDKLGNMATKLYFLRRKARQWRNEQRIEANKQQAA